MGGLGKFVLPFRQSLAVITSSSSSASCSRQLFHGEFIPLKKWVKGIEPVLTKRFSTLHCILNKHREFIRNFRLSGSKNAGSILGVSVIYGSAFFRPHVIHAMDGRDVLVDEYHWELFGASEMEEDLQNIKTVLRKFWLPAFFIFTVLVNWDNPIAIATRVLLFLVSTKPSPTSVYLFTEQLCLQYMRKEPHLYRLKSLFASKVEVQDYKLFCVARVEIRDQKLSLVGILGGWWLLPSSGLCLFRSGGLEHH